MNDPNSRSALFGLHVIAIVVSVLASGPAFGQPFDPLRRNLNWSSDRTIIDLQVVGSTSLLVDSHVLQPERQMKLRLERAYVSSFLRQQDGGFELLNLAVDMPTGLPDAVLLAVATKGPSHRLIAGVPVLRHDERMHRSVLIGIRSDRSLSFIEGMAREAAACAEPGVQNGLRRVG